MKKFILLLSLSISMIACAYTGDKGSNTKSQALTNSAQKTGISFNNGNEQYQLLGNDYAPANNEQVKVKVNTNNPQQKYAYNPRTGNVGILTGEIKVALKPNTNVNLIAEQYNINIKANFAHLKVAFFTINSGQDIIQITNDLNQNSDIESAEIEVTEHVFKSM